MAGGDNPRERDRLRRFVFERLAVRGAVAQLDDTWQAVISRRRYPAPVRQVLGEGLAACALLHATIKFDGMLTLQLQGDGPLRLLVIQCSSDGHLRAVARYGDAASAAQPLSRLVGGGTLTMTIEQRADGERYQGLVALTGDTLAAALEHYFARSEQLPTALMLTADDSAAAGFMVQKLPERSQDADGWNRIGRLTATLTDDELLSLDASTLVRRLYHQETLRLFAPQPLAFRCTCSRERTARMLVGLGQAEVQDILAEQGQVEVSCEFCGETYRYDAIDAEQLFAPPQPDVPPTQH